MTAQKRAALVFGASGFIGRWLIIELLTRGVATTAVLRSDTSGTALLEWLEAHGARTAAAILRADPTRVDFGWRTEDVDHVSEVYNMAGAYAFGMSTQEARTANVAPHVASCRSLRRSRASCGWCTCPGTASEVRTPRRFRGHRRR